MGEADQLAMEALRTLHEPVEHYDELLCKGCDFAGWEGEPPRWPCRTAELVYNGDFILECLEAMDLISKWRFENAPRFAPYQTLLAPGAWARMAETFIADKIFPVVPVMKTNGLTFRYDKEASWPGT
jgi:hypothetical protein